MHNTPVHRSLHFSTIFRPIAFFTTHEPTQSSWDELAATGAKCSNEHLV